MKNIRDPPLIFDFRTTGLKNQILEELKMNNKKAYTLTVYNTITKEYENVAVTEEVYATYRRSGWNIKDSDESFYKHEIQFSGLIGGENGSYENFNEFISDDGNPDLIIPDKLLIEALYKALDTLSETEMELIDAIYFEGKSERKYSAETGIPRMTINSRKQVILNKIKIKLNF